MDAQLLPTKEKRAEKGCIGFVWTDFRSGGTTRVAPCPTEPMPNSSSMDLPLDRAEPVKNYSNASVITDFKRDKKNLLCRCNRGQRRLG